MPPLPVATPTAAPIVPPLPLTVAQAIAPQQHAPQQYVPQQYVPPERALPAPRVYISDDLPDFLDGRARNRRIVLVVVGVALLALLGTIAAAIASHFRPL
jgi:hypothetical protein